MAGIGVGRRVALPAITCAALTVGCAMAGCGASKQAASQAETLASKHSAASRPFATLGLSAAGQPRYFADIVRFSGSLGAGPVQIRSSATGALVPHQPAIQALGIAAYDGGSRLLIARQAGDACASRLYSATLSGRGVLGRLSRIGPRLHGLVWALAADTDGTIVGTTIAGCEKGQSGYLAVIHIRAGSVRRYGSVNLGGTGGDLALGFGLSMSANGRLLAFTGEATSAGGTNAGQRVWVLRTAAPAGTLAQRSRVVLSRPNSGPALSSVVLSPDGRSFYLCTVSTKGTVSAHKPVTQTAVITARQTSDGASTSRLAKLTATGVTFQGFGCTIALTPNGRYLLAPYQLRYGKNTMVPPLVRAAVIRTSSHARRSISFRLPGSGGMSVAIGISVAW
jgi:hypothetical protein